MAIKRQGSKQINLPEVTTAQRSTEKGRLQFNTTLGLAEYYTGTLWKSIDAPPTVSSVDDNEVDSAAGGNQTIVITGSGFATGAIASFVGSSASFNAATTTLDSTTQITAVAPKASFLNAQEPYGVKVLNVSGLSGVLGSAINVDNAPTWTTGAGTVATIQDNATGTHATLAAADAEGDTIAYTETGATNLVGAGMALNSSTGAITGDPTDVGGATTVSFTGRATAGAKTADRSFNIIVTPSPDGSTKARAVTVSAVQNPITQLLAAKGESDGAITEGVYWTYSTNTAAATYYSATAYRNIGGSTWMLMQKNFVPHAYKNGDSVSSLDHPLAYGLMNSDGSAVVATNTYLGSAASNAAASLGDYHLRVPIDTFGDDIFTKCGGYGNDNATFGKATITASTLMGVMKNAQAHSDSNYYGSGWGTYTCDGHGYGLVFWVRDATGDTDYGRMGFTDDTANGQDTHNSTDDYNGITWFGDATSAYTSQDKDSSLNGIEGRLSIWVQ